MATTKKMTPGREGYKILFNENTVIMNYKFAAAAAKYGTPENKLMKNSGMVTSPLARGDTTPRGNTKRLTWNAQKNTTITYRLDRMKGVEVLNEPREGSTEFSKINMETYTQQHFGMFSGEKKRVSLRFTNNLLDTIVDRFGTGADVFYRPDGDRHFVVSTDIAISDQFFGWIAGFRKMAQIVSPPDVVADFQSFLSDISERYESE